MNKERKSGIAAKLDAIPCLALGLFLAVLGYSRATPSFILLPQASTLISIQEYEPVSLEALSHLVEREKSSLEHQSLASEWSNLGLELALLGASSQNSVEALKEARKALINSLTASPSNPYAWARLSTIELVIGSDQTHALTDWRMSVMTGPTESRVALARSKVALAIWSSLSASDRSAVLTDVSAAWRADPVATMGLATDPFSENVIRAALITDLPNLRIFEHALSDKHNAPK